MQHIGCGQWIEAEHVCRMALQSDAWHAEVHHLAGHVAGQLGKISEAIAHLAQAIAINPCHPQYRYNFAVTLGLVGRENEAALQYQACLRQDPQHRDALWNYGEMLRMAEHFELAAQMLERFAALGGDYPTLHHRLGVSYASLHRDAQAEQQFLQELGDQSQQGNALTCWEYGLFLLARERFNEGFACYHRRFEADGRNSVYCHDFGLLRWDGIFVPGSTLLIHGEQGLGDEMMFASLVPEVLVMAQAAQGRVILAVKPPLVRLFQRSFPQAVVVAHRVGGPVADISGLGRVDVQLAIGDLAVLFRAKLKDFEPARQPYLRADPDRAAWYAKQLTALKPPSAPATKLRVGLMWGSNPAQVSSKFVRWSQQRSIPVQMLDQWAALAHQVEFVSLQNTERGHEAALAPRLDIWDLSHLQTDFLETASLIANLDLVISVDTSVSHLAGAMGVETWVPLITRSDWRHGANRTHSYWYANTRYFHQETAGDWGPVLQALEQALASRLAEHEQHRAKPAGSGAHGMGGEQSVERGDLARAVAWLSERKFDLARPFFEKALVASGNGLRERWEYAMQLLTQEQWGQGWDFHEARLGIFGAEGLHLCPLPWPRWQGEPLAGRTIVVHGEQGIGDEIMYLSMLPDVVATGARVVVACAPSLVGLLQSSFPSVVAVAHARGAQDVAQWRWALPAWTRPEVIGPVNVQISSASLGALVRREAADFPRRSYLRVDQQRVAKMAARLAQAGWSERVGEQCAVPLRIGVAWCGSLGDAHARARSMSLAQLQPLMEVGRALGCRFVSLQSRQHAGQLEEMPDFQILDMSSHTDDFADVAALMENLDLVISVDTSFAHLAAALGRPTWRMVIRTCDWRWGWGRQDSVWYPHDRVFRQEVDGDWSGVVKRVAAELASLHGGVPV